MNWKKGEFATLALYKSNAHDSTNNWLAYQAALNEVRLLNFTSDASIKQGYILNVPTEPIQAVRLACDNQNGKIYVAIVFLTKFMVLEKNQLLTQFSIPLNCNIVQFGKGFACAQGIADGRQVYFVFATTNGKIVTQPVSNVENRAVFEIQTGSKVTSLCVRDAQGYIGTNKGDVLMADLNTRKIINRYHTKSEFPILNMRKTKNSIVLGTCDGEVHLLSFTLEPISIVSAHTGMVVLLHTNESNIYSVGDDAVLRIWTNGKQSLLEQSSRSFNQRANLLFTVEGRVYVNFYESLKYEEI